MSARADPTPAPPAPSKSRVLALAGRPNTGKTTLFNALTGLNTPVANFHWTTVEQASGVMECPGRAPVEIVDLPGTFSLLPASIDEKVALEFLLVAAQEGDLRVLCLSEASNLANDLTFALGLKDCGFQVFLALNMIDEAAENGLKPDIAALESRLGLRVFGISARNGDGMDALRDFLSEGAFAAGERTPETTLLLPGQAELAAVQRRAQAKADSAATAALGESRGRVLPVLARTISIDRKLFHPILGPVILGAILFLVFQSLFSWAAPVQDGLESAGAALSGWLRPNLPPLLGSLVCDGVLAGITAVIVFLPQIVILFTMIGLLEASGYLPRAGAMLDRLLRPFGLDGKVFLPFLSSFACAIPGVLAARTIPDERRRITAVLLSPLMTCSARIPVYTLLITAFIPESTRLLGLHARAVALSGLYVFGGAVALALALALKASPLYQAPSAPVTVLPPYRVPKPADLVRYVWTRAGHFITRAGKVIFALSLLLWAAANFPKSRETRELEARIAAVEAAPGADASLLSHLRGRRAAAAIEGSSLGRFGKIIEPVFAPIGYDWRLSIAVLSSLAAREVFVGTLGTIYALDPGEEGAEKGLLEALRTAKGPDGLPRYTAATAVSLLIFFAIAMQCVSTIATVRRETGGWGWPAAQFAVFFVLAYGLAWTGYRLTGLLL